jgi:hypothetical protein
MAEKSRKTTIIAHCAKETLVKRFPDRETKKFTIFYDGEGNQVGTAAGHPGEFSGESINLLAEFAVAAGYGYDLLEDHTVDQNWISLNNDIYCVRALSTRKSSITVNSSNRDEADHYAIVDQLVALLAGVDIAVLNGECHITITTKC